MDFPITSQSAEFYGMLIEFPSDDASIETEDNLSFALSNQKHDNTQLGEALVNMGIIDQSDLIAVLDIQDKISDPLEVLCLVSGIRCRLGEILLKTKHITSHQLEQALELQRSSDTPLGEVLIDLGWVTKQELNTSLTIQRHQQKMENEGRRLRLGETLVLTNEITRQQLQQALDKQKQTGKKLGEVLVEEGYVNTNQVNRVLQVQNQS
ncbi:MAG: hypothetical protein V4568_04625 [Pseudomonadota bacterium]